MALVQNHDVVRHSRRTLPRNLSQMGFRFGDLGGMLTTSIPVPSATAVNLLPNLSSLSRIRYRALRSAAWPPGAVALPTGHLGTG